MMSFFFDIVYNNEYKGKKELIIIGNKKNLEDEKVKGNQKILELAKREKYKVFYTSTATGEGIDEALEYLMDKLVNKKDIQFEEKKDSNDDNKDDYAPKKSNSFKLHRSKDNLFIEKDDDGDNNVPKKTISFKLHRNKVNLFIGKDIDDNDNVPKKDI